METVLENDLIVNEKEKPSWTSNLKDISDSFSFDEFNEHRYTYKRVKDPDNNDTDYYAIFYKNLKVDSDWVAASGLLSKHYTIAQSEEIAKALKEEINVKNERVIGAPFLLSYYAKTDKTGIKVFNDDCSKKMFEIISGIESDRMENMQTSVTINFLNTYNGTQSIRVNYILDLSYNDDGGENKSKLNDYFLLSQFGHRFEHRTSSLGKVTTELPKIQEYCDMSVTTFKNCKNKIVGYTLDEFAAQIASRFKKVQGNIFDSYWDSTPPEYKNFLSMLIITSSILDHSYDVKVHNSLSRLITPAINHLLKPVVEKK